MYHEVEKMAQWVRVFAVKGRGPQFKSPAPTWKARHGHAYWEPQWGVETDRSQEPLVIQPNQHTELWFHWEILSQTIKLRNYQDGSVSQNLSHPLSPEPTLRRRKRTDSTKFFSYCCMHRMVCAHAHTHAHTHTSPTPTPTTIIRAIEEDPSYPPLAFSIYTYLLVCTHTLLCAWTTQHTYTKCTKCHFSIHFKTVLSWYMSLTSIYKK